jgi:hypothetical protein
VTATLSPDEREERRRRRRREELVRWSLRVLVILLVFAFGIALGEALHDNPKPGDTVTFQRTLTVPSGPAGSTIVP